MSRLGGDISRLAAQRGESVNCGTIFLLPRQYFFFPATCTRTFSCNVSRGKKERKRERTPDKWRGQLRCDTMSKYRVENGTVPESTCEGHKYSPSTYGRKKLAGLEEKSALLRKLSVKNVSPADC